MFEWFKSGLNRRKQQKKVVFSFKVKVHGSEIVDVTLTGSSASAVAALANRLKTALDVKIDNRQYKQADKTTEEFKNSTFEKLMKMFGMS
jgi:hypothetical protein